MGLYKGDIFEEWLTKLWRTKGIRTFADIPEGYLKVVVSDVSLGKLIVIPDDLETCLSLDPKSF